MNQPDASSSAHPLAPAAGLGRPAEVLGREPVSGLRGALHVRVRFAKGELPLWSLLSPLVIVVALASAFAVSAVSHAPPRSESAERLARTDPEPAQPGPTARAEPSLAAASPASAEAKPAAAPAPPAAAPAAGAELPSLEGLPKTIQAAEVLALASQRAEHGQARARSLAALLDRDPTLAQDDATQAEMRRLLDNQETSRQVLGAIASLPGPIAADLLYEVWTGTVLRNETTDLARALLLSHDVRSKASPALAVALDLRLAERCEENAAILPRALEHGDRRSLHLLIKLTRKYGCGPNKRDDCHPCLRGEGTLDQAVKAVKNRREPKTFGRR